MKNLIVNPLGLGGGASLILSLFLSAPVVSIIIVALQPSGDVWSHLVNTALPGYVSTTLILSFGVGSVAVVLGTSTAWLVTMCRFPARKYLNFLLLLPLAMPSYVVAYAYTDFLEYAGPLQTFLRYLFEWTNPEEYWFPEIRSLGGGVVVMSFVLYPYIYLLARSAFLEQSVNVLEVSRVLGRGPWGTFLQVSLPSARPAIVVGVSLVLMETLNDYGTVDFFAIPTMTFGLVDVWFGMNNVAGAAQIASALLIFVVLLIAIENFSRRRQRYYQQSSTRFSTLPNYQLKGWRSFLATSACLFPIIIGFAVPAVILLVLSVKYFSVSWTPEFRLLVANSLVLSISASLLVLAIAIFLTYCRRMYPNAILGVAIKIASVGYAMPGAVLAIGILIPLATFDNFIDSIGREWFGLSTGLLFSGTLFAVLFAYIVRFLTIAIGQIESSLGKISSSMDMASKTLGYTRLRGFWSHHFPLIRGGAVVALIIVFVDCMKELPATLILRPFNFDTLAVHVYHYASDEMLGEAALGCMFIVAVGLLPVLLLSSMLSKSRNINEGP